MIKKRAAAPAPKKKKITKRPLPENIVSTPYVVTHDGKPVRVVQQKDAPKHSTFPRLAKNTYDTTAYVYDPAAKRVVAMVTVMPDGLNAAWGECGRCNASIHRCKCQAGLVEPKSIVWMWHYTKFAMENKGSADKYDQRHTNDPKYTQRHFEPSQRPIERTAKSARVIVPAPINPGKGRKGPVKPAKPSQGAADTPQKPVRKTIRKRSGKSTEPTPNEDVGKAFEEFTDMGQLTDDAAAAQDEITAQILAGEDKPKKKIIKRRSK